MNLKRNISKVALWILLLLGANILRAENIDPDNDGSQYAYGENIGWLNFEPGQGPGVHVSETQLTGYAWAENIGRINLSPSTYGGVVNNGAGNLFGYAWGENVGWINFNPVVSGDPTHYGVTIDSDGNFTGWAWGENIGWIHFQSPPAAAVEYKVRVCMVTLKDLALFSNAWLQSGDVPANLDWDGDPGNNVNMVDYSILASYWLSYCPDDWPW